jgi:hypothetical protein
MVEQPDIHPPPDDQPDVDKFAALADAPVTALGLSNGDADALEQALDVKTVRDLADNKYVRRAQAIVNLANEKQSRDLLPSPGIGRVRVGWQQSMTVVRPRVGPPALGRAALPGGESLNPGSRPGSRPKPWGWWSAPGAPNRHPQTRHGKSFPRYTLG